MGKELAYAPRKGSLTVSSRNGEGEQTRLRRSNRGLLSRDSAPDIPTDVKAMAIYNRSLAYHAIHENAKAAEDLTALLEKRDYPKE